MLMCSNAHVTGGFSIFGHLMLSFWVSHRFETPIKGYKVMNSFMLLAGFEFLVGMYG